MNPAWKCVNILSWDKLLFFPSRLWVLRPLQPLQLHRLPEHCHVRQLQAQHQGPELPTLQTGILPQRLCRTGWWERLHRSVCRGIVKSWWRRGGVCVSGVSECVLCGIDVQAVKLWLLSQFLHLRKICIYSCLTLMSLTLTHRKYVN